MKYQDILKNEHFNNLAAIVRVPFLSEEWRSQHPQVKFWTLLDGLNEIKTEQHFTTNRQVFIARFCELLATITAADPCLAYATDDLAWFVSAMDGPEAQAIASLLFAWFSAPDTMLTPAEVAGMTGTAESGWRNKAAAGEIPGAIKKGKQWLLPASVLRGQGVLSNIPRCEDDSRLEP